MPRVARKVDPAAAETWRKNVVEAVTELVKEVEAPAEVAEAPAPAPAAPAAPAPVAEKKKVVRVVKKKTAEAAAPAAPPADTGSARKTGLYPHLTDKKKPTKKVAANAPLTEVAPAPAHSETKREKHPNAKQFVKISEEVRGKLAAHPHKEDRTYMRRLRTHLMLGKSYEEATKLADAKKSASA
jgi:hypothetical protein